jgi:hypothetical protein
MIDVPLCAEVKLPAALAGLKPGMIKVRLKAGEEVPGQIISCGGGKTRLCWVAPSIKAGSKTAWTATLSKREKPCAECFEFKDTKDEHLDLACGDRLVTRFMYKRDTTDNDTKFKTSKCYHHVFGVDGKTSITKGNGGKYPHHRGIFIGWSRIKFKGKGYDLWHLRKGEVIRWRQFESLCAGPVLGRSAILLDWKTTDDGEVILSEKRTVTVYKQAKPTILLLDFVTTVTAPTDDVELGGDPEHAGFQYRPTNDLVAKTEGSRMAKYMYFKDEVNAKNCKQQQGMPWVAMNYALAKQDYSVLHMNHEDNPKNAVYSAYRDYGRFGCWTRHTLKKGESLTLKYRVWVTADKMPAREACAARRAAFVAPPEVSVK